MKNVGNISALLILVLLIITANFCTKIQKQYQDYRDSVRVIRKSDSIIVDSVLRNYEPIIVKPCPAHCSWQQSDNHDADKKTN